MSDLPAAVLWDMDGTLVDTEPSWLAAETALVRAHGGSWSTEQATALIGSALPTAAAVIREQGPVDLPPEVIVERLLDAVEADVRQRVPWRPGARELLDSLVDVGVPCALVTMSYARLAQAVVSALPAGTFEVVVTGDEVVHGKPHPEPYLTAAAQLGVEPGECIAIEDSLSGVASAQAAGVPVIAVQHLVAIPPAPGRVVLESLADLTPADLAAHRDRIATCLAVGRQ